MTHGAAVAGGRRARRLAGAAPFRLAARGARYAWAGPNTLLGLAVALLAVATGGRARRREGVLEAHGGLLRPLLRRAVPIRGGARALTLGHVVLARTAAGLSETRAHERAHVRQYERWGPFFLPAYLASGAWAAVRGRSGYRDNRFEREAFATANARAGPSRRPEGQPAYGSSRRASRGSRSRSPSPSRG